MSKKYWIKKKDVVSIKYKQKLFKNIHIFKNIPYKWGGKTYQGIDCSALVQLFFKFNNLYCPRDTKDQIKYFKKAKKIYNEVGKKGEIFLWYAAKQNAKILLQEEKSEQA